MTYRKGFITLKAVGCHSYTYDCGWGCMLRCSQMILSKALIDIKAILVLPDPVGAIIVPLPLFFIHSFIHSCCRSVLVI